MVWPARSRVLRSSSWTPKAPTGTDEHTRSVVRTPVSPAGTTVPHDVTSSPQESEPSRGTNRTVSNRRMDEPGSKVRAARTACGIHAWLARLQGFAVRRERVRPVAVLESYLFKRDTTALSIWVSSV